MKLPKDVSIQEIASLIGGKVHNPDDKPVKVNAVSMNPLEAKDGDVAFLFDQKYLSRLSECNATIVIIPTGTKCARPCVYVDRPLLAISKVLHFFAPKRFFPEPGVHPSAVVDPTAELGEGVAIGPFVAIGPKAKIGARTRIMAGCVIGGEVVIGENCLLYPGSLVADYVKMGNRVILQQGAVLGSDGFAYVTEKTNNMERRMAGNFDLVDESNPHIKVPQIGSVVIGDDVEIGSCATVDRATMGSTAIGRGSKIDNLVMVAHNCKIGEEVLIVAQTAVAGSCTVGNRVIIAGQAGISDHTNIGTDAIVQGQAGVMKDLAAGDVVCGTPSVPARAFMTQVAMLRRLPKMHDELKSMKKRIEELEALLAEGQLVSQGRGK